MGIWSRAEFLVAIRRVGAFGVLDVLSLPGDACYAASMNTDACHGNPVMRYQSSHLAFEPGGNNCFVLGRLTGHAS